MAIRQESLVTATSSGYVDYYTRDYAKVRKGGVVYGIGASEQPMSTRELSESDCQTFKAKPPGFPAILTVLILRKAVIISMDLENEILLTIMRL